MFKPLTKADITKIIDLCIADLNRRLKDRELTVSLDEAAKSYCVDNGYDPAFGARPLKRFIQKNVETLAARIILEGKVREGDTIGLHVDAKTGGLVAEVEKTE